MDAVLVPSPTVLLGPVSPEAGSQENVVERLESPLSLPRDSPYLQG